MTSAKSVTATFTASTPTPTNYTLSVSVSGAGSVSSTPAGINCGSACSASYANNTVVSLTASASTGNTFNGWGGACTGASTSCSITMSAARSVTATFTAPPPAAGTCSQVSQYGIVFSFDKAYPCGQFANGDYWVTPTTSGGNVNIASITPAYTGSLNGFEVNPNSVVKQGFDSHAPDFDASRVPALPYAARAGQSIVKAVSVSGNAKTFLNTAAVLTVLGAVPPDNGATVFRPPYFGTDKTLYSTNNLLLNNLPHYAPVANTPTLATIQQRYQRVQLDHLLYWSGDQIHPVQNMPDYGGQIATDNAEAALRLMLNDTNQAKLPAAINFVQYGIDLAAARRGGLHFESDGGHRHGRKLVLALTADLLDDSNIRALVHDAPYNTYQDDGDLYYSANAGTVLWGKPDCSAGDYWDNQNTGNNSRDCRDPYGYIDGGQEPGGYYQFCCTSMGFKATALALRLMPELQCIWNNNDILVYADRWVTFGVWSKPDPYAAHGNGALGSGRWPALHGTQKDSGYYASDFSNSMWSAYRAGAPAAPSCGP